MEALEKIITALQADPTEPKTELTNRERRLLATIELQAETIEKLNREIEFAHRTSRNNLAEAKRLRERLDELQRVPRLSRHKPLEPEPIHRSDGTTHTTGTRNGATWHRIEETPHIGKGNEDDNRQEEVEPEPRPPIVSAGNE